MAIDTDELEPRKPLKADAPPDLARLSIEELEARIASLEAEIVRCREMIAAKQKTRSAAESVFRR
jgi:uncharacterized small protein (DUF1192 family)